MDLPLPVFLADALVGRQPGQSVAQVVVVWLPYYKQPPRKLDYIQTQQHCDMKVLAAAVAIFSMFAAVGCRVHLFYLWANSCLAHGSTVLIVGDADQRVPAVVMWRIILGTGTIRD